LGINTLVFIRFGCADWRIPQTKQGYVEEILDEQRPKTPKRRNVRIIIYNGVAYYDAEIVVNTGKFSK